MRATFATPIVSSPAEDQLLEKPQKDYVRERGPFNGFALEAARKLSELIELKPVSEQTGR